MRPWHPAIEAAERAVRQAMIELGFDGAQAREMIRVEATWTMLNEIAHSLDQGLTAPDPRKPRFPAQIMGVTYYEAHDLPEPFWRVRGWKGSLGRGLSAAEIAGAEVREEGR